jgi:hypothetical protein
MSTITYTPNSDGVTFTGSDGNTYILDQTTGAYTIAPAQAPAATPAVTYTPNSDGVTFTGSDGNTYIQNQTTGAYTVYVAPSSSATPTLSTVTVNGVQYTDNGDNTYTDANGNDFQHMSDGSMQQIVSKASPTPSAEDAALISQAPEATSSDYAASGPAGVAPGLTPALGTLVTVTKTCTVVFTDADPNNSGQNPDTNAEIHTATLIITTSTVDQNVSVVVQETVPQGQVDNPVVTITATVTTTDPKVSVTLNPNLTTTGIVLTPTTSETTDANGVVTSVLTVTLAYTHAQVSVFTEQTTNSTLTQAPVEPDYRYLIMPQHLVIDTLHDGGGDANMTCVMLHSMFNVGIFKMSEVMYHTLRSGWEKAEVIEVDADTAKYGVAFFGEIRPVAKLFEAANPWYPATKTPTAITDDIVDKILTVMKGFATEVIESEYERRYLTARGASDFEADTWTIQREEAKAFQSNPNADTPFIDDLVALEGITKAALVTKILAEQADYYKRISTMLVQMKGLIAKFNACTTVWDINILYEDYFGIAMPVAEALKLGRMASETDWTRKPGFEVKGNGYYF